MKRTTIIAAAALLALAGCTERDLPEDKGGSCHIDVVCEDTAEYDMTRSMFTDNALTRVNGVNIWIYSDGVLDAEHSAYYSPATGISISFDRLDAEYDIYMLANAGKAQGPQNEADVAAWTYSFTDYGRFEQDGFPMANAFLGYRPGSQATFKLKRLVGEYVIDIEDSSSKVRHTVKSVQLKNCALQVMPFNEDACCNKVTEEGDYLSPGDIATLNAGGQVSLYFLENLQGVLLPGNTDPKKKTPDYITDSEKRRRCTYIEVDTEADTPTAHYDSVRYRAYLGQDMTSDFNIRRSTRYYLTLNFEANMVRQEEWRIEPEEPDIIGDLKWSSRDIWITKSSTVIDDQYLDVICPDSRVDYTVEWDSAEAEAAMCTITKSATGRYRIHTDHPIDAYAPGSSTSLSSVTASPSTKDVHVTVKSYDGLITDTATIHVVHECFPVRIYYDQTTRTMKAEAWHPCGQSLAFTLITCSVTGEGHYQKSGIAGDSWESAMEQKAWSVERYTVSTSRNGATTHSLDKDSSNSLNGVMQSIESHTVLYDNTWLGTNHNYYPMYPISVNLRMSIAACSQSGNQQGDITNPLATNCPFYLWNDPDNVVYDNRFQPFDQAFQTSHTGTFDVFLAGQDMRIKYYHSSGSTHAFYNGDTFHWHDTLPNGGIIAYEIKKEGSTYMCNISGTRPRPVTLSVIGSAVSSQYTTHWKGGSRVEFR